MANEAQIDTAFVLIDFKDRIERFIAEGNQTAACDQIEKMLASFPFDAGARHIAALSYIALQDYREALIQSGIGIALEPTYALLFRNIACILMHQKQEDVARRILENGWKHYEDLLRDNEIYKNEFYETDKEWYFSLSLSSAPSNGGA